MSPNTQRDSCSVSNDGIISDIDRDEAEKAAETLVATSQGDGNARRIRFIQSTPSSGFAASASQHTQDELLAADALLQFSQRAVIFNSGPARPRQQARQQRTEQTAAWTLLTVGRTEFFNASEIRDFSQDEIVRMRNQGEITEQDFLDAFRTTVRAAPSILVGFLDPNRPNVLTSGNILPPRTQGRGAGRRPRPVASRRSTRVQNQRAAVVAAAQGPSATAQPKNKTVAVKKTDGPANDQTGGKRAVKASPARPSPIRPKEENQDDDTEDDLETADDETSSEDQKSRAPLLAGPPKWEYLETTTTDDNGKEVKHNYKPRSGKKPTAKDFQDPKFCRDVNRWYRQLHRRRGAARMRRQAVWSPEERAELTQVLRDSKDATWEEICREFNKRMNLRGSAQRTAVAMKSYASKNSTIRDAKSKATGKANSDKAKPQSAVFKLNPKTRKFGKKRGSSEEEDSDDTEDEDEESPPPKKKRRYG